MSLKWFLGASEIRWLNNSLWTFIVRVYELSETHSRRSLQNQLFLCCPEPLVQFARGPSQGGQSQLSTGTGSVCRGAAKVNSTSCPQPLVQSAGYPSEAAVAKHWFSPLGGGGQPRRTVLAQSAADPQGHLNQPSQKHWFSPLGARGWIEPAVPKHRFSPCWGLQQGWTEPAFPRHRFSPLETLGWTEAAVPMCFLSAEDPRVD